MIRRYDRAVDFPRVFVYDSLHSAAISLLLAPLLQSTQPKSESKLRTSTVQILGLSVTLLQGTTCAKS
ncbi:unnamed protein product [Calypogeia fissa]